VSGSFDPNPTTDGSALTLAVAATVSPGSYPLTVSATSATGHSESAELTLSVTPAAEAGFELSLEPTSLTLKQGERATVAVTITRAGGFSDPVELSVGLKPDAQHVTVTFDPASAAGSSTMTVIVGNNLPARSYLLEVRALSGTLRDTAPLGLLVAESE
jgi:hypothetical protein